jgi:tetratricopeptide (TPR) repeat protein
VVARWRLARILSQQGRGREALGQVERALMQDPANPVLHLERARALASIGDAAALDAYQLAVTNAEVMARRPAEEREPFGRLAPPVRALLNDVMERDGGRFVDRCRQAFAQYLTERRLWEQALTQWTVLLADSPKNPAAHVGRGIAFEALGARERAVEAYREAVALDGSAPIRARYAQALWQTDQYYQAMNEWRAILGRSPGNVDARLALARAYVRTGNRSEATLEYQRLLQIAPERPEPRQELARLRGARS